MMDETLRQPNMESDSADRSSNMQKLPIAELQDVVSDEMVDPQEETQTEALSDKFKVLFSQLETSSLELLNSPKKQIYKELSIWEERWPRTRDLVKDAQNRELDSLPVKLWLADVKEVLNDMDNILYEIMHANRSRQTAQVQSSANVPRRKRILSSIKKVAPRLLYDREREKALASKMKDITVRLQYIFKRAGEMGLKDAPSSTPQESEPKNLGRKEFDVLQAIYKGRFWNVGDFFQNNPDAMSTTFENGKTALHVAITVGQLRIAKELIVLANSHHLVIQDESGNTALSFAARSGMMEIAKCLIEKNKDLLTIPDTDRKIPVQLACGAGHEDMTRYLYGKTSKEFLNGDNGFRLLEECITKKMFDIALHLLSCFPKFAIYKFFIDDSIPIISTLAQTPLLRENHLSFWRRWIYNCMRMKVDEGSVPSDGVAIVTAQPGGTLISMLLKFLAKQIYGLKLMDTIAHKIIHVICRELSTLDEDQFVRSGAVEAAFQAIENGIPDIVIEITKVNTNILWNSTDPEDSSRNMFACAVAHRQEEAARFLYGFDARMGTNIVSTTEKDGNNLLHLAAKLAPRSHLNCISGAVLQLQSEIRWFNAVKGIVPQFFNYDKNVHGATPYQAFLEEHNTLLKEAEEWMKKTAESSTVVGALIITIMFAVAFTVPGGNDQSTGFPIFLNKTADSSTISSPTVPFMLFVASDAISLFAASSSVLMFLGILTSRYAFKDFLKSLPVKLIIGISSLFISIAAMMVAFCVALFIMLQGRLWIIIPVTLLAGIPVIIFALLQFPFLVELYTLTFGPVPLIGRKTSP